MTDIKELLGTGDSFAAIEQIQRTGSPLEIAARYASLVSDFYWKSHDLPAVVTIGRAGILYCLGKSLEAVQSAEAVEKLRSVAKGLAYDGASFTWPGWEEPGIQPTPEDLAIGRECAQLNLRLAIELKKPPERLSMAHWLVGAHVLAARDARTAEKHFQLAQEILPITDPASRSMEPLNSGYLAVARLCQNPADVASRAEFDAIISKLETRADQDAATYRAQLLSARRMFVACA